MADLVTTIRERQRRLAELEAESAQIKKELLEAKQALLAVDPSPAPQSKAGNSTEWATAVLRSAGRPMHANDIVAAIERDFQVGVKAATLVGNLSRLIKNGKTFDRFGPNVFGLKDWKSEADEEELFGRLEREREYGVETGQ